MTRSPTTRRSQLLSSPERNIAASFLLDTRNNELSHRDALAAAQVEHERVRQAAIRVYELHELQQEHRRIVEEERKEQERLRAEALVVAEEKRLRELKAKTIPRLPPEPEPPTPPPAPKPDPSKTTNGTTPVKETKRVEPSTTPPSDIKKPALAPPTTSSPFAPQNKPTISSPLAAVGTTSGQTTTHGLFQKTNGTATAQPAALASTQPVAKPAAPPALLAASPTEDRYSQIHQELKKLRRELQAQSKVPGSPLKGKLGTFRREIRVAIGQLTGGKGANAKPVQKITDTLKEALRGNTPSPPIDVSLFVVDKREPVQGATHNDQTLPSLFIYLMNICAKAIINQFINEGGANPKAADPVGVFTAHIFSNQEFEWRGQSLIDIVMAKYRIVCPVLFGHRGSDRTERGRISIGWKKDGPAWITEQSHNDRMTGLGAGFASLSLRDFSKSSKKNPYPPTNYWKALAYIVNSPPNEISNTQYVVLRSMIQGHEQRFLNFYGNAALAALRLALVEFPKKAPQNATAAGSLAALADVLKSESGLVLA